MLNARALWRDIKESPAKHKYCALFNYNSSLCFNRVLQFYNLHKLIDFLNKVNIVVKHFIFRHTYQRSELDDECDKMQNLKKNATSLEVFEFLRTFNSDTKLPFQSGKYMHMFATKLYKKLLKLFFS